MGYKGLKKKKKSLPFVKSSLYSLVFLHIEEKNYRENSGILTGSFICLPWPSQQQIKMLFAGKVFPSQNSSPQAAWFTTLQFWARSQCLSETLEVATALIQGFLPYTLPKKKEPRPLESPSVHAGFPMKQNRKSKTHSQNTVPSPYSHSSGGLSSLSSGSVPWVCSPAGGTTVVHQRWVGGPILHNSALSSGRVKWH